MLCLWWFLPQIVGRTKCPLKRWDMPEGIPELCKFQREVGIWMRQQLGRRTLYDSHGNSAWICCPRNSVNGNWALVSSRDTSDNTLGQWANLLTYLLTPWSRVLLEKLTGFAASQEIPRIYGTQWRTEGGGLGGSNPPRNSEILTKYQKLRKIYYMKWNLLYQITAASRTPD
jgi:hypothetical protein